MLDLNQIPYALAVLLVALCTMYMFVVTCLLIRDAFKNHTNNLDVLHKVQRFCRSAPRTDSIPIPVLEILLDAIDRADANVDIDKLVIGALFQHHKNEGKKCS